MRDVVTQGVGEGEGEGEGIVAACSGQTIGNRRAKLFINLATSIVDGGPLICVEALGTAAAAAVFIEEALNADLALTEFCFVFSSDLGRPSAYPAMTFRTKAEPLEIDLERQYEALSPLVGDGE